MRQVNKHIAAVRGLQKEVRELNQRARLCRLEKEEAIISNDALRADILGEIYDGYMRSIIELQIKLDKIKNNKEAEN